MNTFRRFSLLGLFATCGATAAACLAISSTTPAGGQIKLLGCEITMPTWLDQRNNSEPHSNRPAVVVSIPAEPKLAVDDAEPEQAETAWSVADDSPFRPSPLRSGKMPQPPRPAPSSQTVSRRPVATQPVAAPVQPMVAQNSPPSADVEASVPVSTMLQVLDKLIKNNEHPADARQDDKLFAQNDDLPAAPPAAILPPAAPRPTSVVSEDDNHLTLRLTESDIREVLELISQGTGLNILATRSVTGTVTASLHNVDAQTALQSILKSTGYVSHQEDDIIYVGAPGEFGAEPAPAATIGRRIYEPNYVTAAELQKLITPMLTPDIGTISVTTPADNGIQSDSAAAGGDTYANAEILLVRDYEYVLSEVDQIYRQVDKRPIQVAIEAMILSVRLDDSTELGVNFQLLKDHIRVASGTPPADIFAVAAEGGLKFGFMDSSVTTFIEALETVGDTNVLATPRLTVLNKQRAEILIGSELGYVSSTVTETSLTQSVEFLEVGTSLRLRPFVSSDGRIRMEIHPELSTGTVRVEEGFTLPDKETTQVTTNIIANDGSTIIIGGLIREDITSNSTQIPFFGSLPVVGPAFRQKTDETERRELLVLITPRIMYDPEMALEGDLGAMEFHHRQAIAYKKNVSPLAARRLSDGHFRRAQVAWANGKPQAALRHANLAIHYNPQSRKAIDLRTDIVEGIPVGDHTGQAPFIPLPNNAAPLDGPTVAPWILDGLAPDAEPIVRPLHPLNPGTPGPRVDLQPGQNLIPEGEG